ncbi:MAG: hypothetical protein MJ051_01735 [Akkermansia sp.]|nr:hypothetical protein [Akkermansia sp.]
MSFTTSKIQSVWEKGREVSGCDKDVWRKDFCDAWICRTEYGNRSSEYGWEIDHVYPIDKLQEKNIPQSKWNEMANLRPMHWENNNSKDNDYPRYTAVKTSEGNKNINETSTRTIPESLQTKLKALYNI